MKLHHNLFHSDRLYVSRWELIKLFFGWQLRVSALIVEVGDEPHPQSAE